MTSPLPRRVLFVLDSLHMGGGERAALALGGALQEAGWQVDVAVSSTGPLAARADELDLTVHVVGDLLAKRRVCGQFADALTALVRRLRPAIVHTHMFASTVAAAAAVRDSSARLVVHEHSMADWRTPHDEACIAPAYSRADAVIAVSKPIAHRLLTVDRVPSSVVHVLPNPPIIDATGRPPAALPHGRPAVGVVARLVPEKGVEHFIQAAARVQRLRPDATFVIVGDGPLRRDLERLADELDVSVHFLGCRPDGPQLIAALDILAVPSLSEGTPLTVLEAAHGRTPVVASCVGGIPEQVRHRREALLVPPADEAALEAAILELLDDHVLARRLATASAARLADAPTLASTAQRVTDIYEDLLPGAGLHHRRIG